MRMCFYTRIGKFFDINIKGIHFFVLQQIKQFI